MSEQHVERLIEDLGTLDADALLAESRRAGERAVLLRRLAEASKSLRAVRRARNPERRGDEHHAGRPVP